MKKISYYECVYCNLITEIESSGANKLMLERNGAEMVSFFKRVHESSELHKDNVRQRQEYKKDVEDYLNN